MYIVSELLIFSRYQLFKTSDLLTNFSILFVDAMTDYCVHCGRIAIVFNDLNQPVCPVCRSKAPKEISCDICSAMMIVRQGKFGDRKSVV